MSEGRHERKPTVEDIQDAHVRLLSAAYNLTVSGTLTRAQAAELLRNIGAGLEADFTRSCEIWDADHLPAGHA